MRMLQVLAEVVSTEEFLRLVAFAELMHVVQVICSHIPLGWIGELFATVAAGVHATAGRRRMEGSLGTGECCAGPRMPPQMK